MSDVSNLPPGWAQTTLGEVADIKAGYAFSKVFQGRTVGEIPFAKVGDISAAVADGSRSIGSAANYVSYDDLADLKAKPVPPGSIAFAKIGEAIRLNRRALTSRDMVFDNNVMALVPFDKIIDPVFLLEFMNTQDLYKLALGGAIPSLRKSTLANIKLGLAPLSEQRRIVAKIEALQERSQSARTALEAIPPLLEKFRQSVLAAAFRGDLTADWRVQNPVVEPASELLDRIRTERRAMWEVEQLKKHAAKEKNPPKYWKNKYPEPDELDGTKMPELPNGWCWVRVSDACLTSQGAQIAKKEWIRESRDGYKRYLYISDFKHERSLKYVRDEYPDKEVSASDLIMANTGSPGEVFRGVPGVLSNNLFRISFSDSIFSQDYAYHYFRSPHFWGRLAGDLKGGAQQHLGHKLIGRQWMPVAPLAEQALIDARVKTALENADQVSSLILNGIKSQEKLEQSILAKAFRGELVSQIEAERHEAMA